ncbi:hydroxymethylbilane synthase [Promicromonospora umidemergens]|uniref:Porphobilinogen deaminase n=1 Tax=Promicromonospora umidemergens TaxID=629679 RepID=A0ABP8XIV9_9MICO|nr:hydroxymethylbilane synthase [Promicromonospora umidemergens]MCP2282778.1 hydroxymethylbilane synthase [Promicromonospora umidemergens]
MSSPVLRIVTRSSPMARVQVERVRGLLAHTSPELDVEVVPVTTTADRWTGHLSALGGKENFVREVDAVLAAGAADVAVHCLKDMPGEKPLPPGMTIAGYLERDDVRDCLVSPAGLTLAELPPRARIGTSSVRRRAQLTAIRPDLEFTLFRGNANRRLEKLAAGEVDAAILAVSGLERIGRTDVITETFEPEVMLPPVGAGILALQCRADDDATLEVLAPLNDPTTWREAAAERMFLHVLQGHCNSPIAGWASHVDDELQLHGAVYSLDGKTVLTTAESAAAFNPVDLGMSVALALVKQGARDVITDAAQHP